MNLLSISHRLAGAILLAILVGAAPQRAQGSSPDKLVVSYVPGNAIYWDIDAAIEKGFFKDEGFAPEVVIFQSSPQSIQLLVAGEVQLAGAQPEALLAAVVHGSKGFAVISSPAERPDWFLVGRPEIKTLAELKGKFFGTGGLQLGENWWTFKGSPRPASRQRTSACWWSGPARRNSRRCSAAVLPSRCCSSRPRKSPWRKG